MTKKRLDKRDLPVVILCGGQGTRLREHTEYVPKPMVEIGEQPILWHIMKIYGSAGFERFVLCLGSAGRSSSTSCATRDARLHHRHGHRRLTPQRGRPRELARHPRDRRRHRHRGAALAGARHVDAPTFCSPTATRSRRRHRRAARFHHAQGRLPPSPVCIRPRVTRDAVEDGRAVEFNEKPTVAEGVVSGGFFVFQREVFDYLPAEPGHFLEQQPLQRLARDGQLSVYVHEGFWHPMDTYRDYLHLNALWKQELPPWKVW
jgi:glucose-1-phosphate cytidylyltransferase